MSSPPSLLEEADHVEGVERVEDAERVAEAQAVGALLLGGLAEAQQELEVGARGVLGVDRHVQVLGPWRRRRTRGSGRAPTAATSAACARCGCRWPTCEMATASTPQSIECLTSSMTARFQARMDVSSPRSTICLIVAFSSPPIAGMPTSIWWTPTSSSSLAMRIFSWLEKTTPAVCSPSRRVVSSMRTAGSAGRPRAMTKLERSLVMVTCLSTDAGRPGVVHRGTCDDAVSARDHGSARGCGMQLVDELRVGAPAASPS